jgi:hypothetical protein
MIEIGLMLLEMEKIVKDLRVALKERFAERQCLLCNLINCCFLEKYKLYLWIKLYFGSRLRRKQRTLSIFRVLQN